MRRRSGDSSRTPLTASWAPLPGVGEPEGLRGLVEGDLLRLGEVGGDDSGAPLRRARTGAGVRGLPPPVVGSSGSGARGRGFEGGRSIPSPVPVFNTG